jgi:ELWxxDGT repeat protein
MIKDIHANTGTSQGSNPASLCSIGSITYFSATTNAEGRELWKSDGTAGGTWLVLDINPGVSDSSPQYLTAFNGEVYFQANGGTYGYELWKTDGTPGGTVMVKDIDPGSASSSPSGFVVINSTLFFSAQTATDGRELWKTDGTTVGTVQVKNIYAGNGSGDPRSLTNVNGTLFFTASEAANPIGLWKSDGTSGGTVLVKTFQVSRPDKLTAVNSTLFFSALDSFSEGFELWKSDGTTVGTVLVKDVNPGAPDSYLQDLTNVNGTLFFSAIHASYGQELWKSDGTTGGTSLVKDLYSGTAGSGARFLVSFGGLCYFTASDGTTGRELWKSDGTAGNATLVKDIRAGSMGAFDPKVIPQFVSIGGTMYFAATNGLSAESGSGRELWKTDGTSGGTQMVKDIRPGDSSSDPYWLAIRNGSLMFNADDGSLGKELWTSDGTSGGTSLVKDVRATWNVSHIYGMVEADQELYFTADDNTHGPELWKSDGSLGGTNIVKDLNSGAAGSGGLFKTTLNDSVILVGYQPATGYELFVSDGTDPGTTLLKDIRSGSADAFNAARDPLFTSMGGQVYFAADDGSGLGLWTTDGTPTGTVLVRRFYAQTYPNASLQDLKEMNGILYAITTTGGSASELWKSNGTGPGTIQFKSVPQGAGSLTPAGGIMYLVIGGGYGIGLELYKTNGTDAGTVLIKNIAPDGQDSRPQNLLDVDGALYFTAEDGQLPWSSDGHGRELWKSDGTSAGTVLVKDIFPGEESSVPGDLLSLNGRVLFAASDPDNGRELWISDGTDVGTTLLKDIRSGFPGSSPAHLARVGTGNGPFAMFAASDGANGVELWWTDSTSVGTQLLVDIVSGAGSSNPNSFFTAGGIDFFLADDSVNGEELWTIDVSTIDSDSDGIPDIVEGSADADGDGNGNNRDTDSDGDGVADSAEGSVDTDSDGVPDFLDTDSDNDGLPDGWEVSYGLDRLDATGTDGADGDSDSDGYANAEEYLNNTSPGVSNPHPISVSTPNGAESWLLGSAHSITWADGAVGGNVKIELFKNRVIVRVLNPIISAATGTWSWSIPMSETIGTDYRVKVTSLDDTHISDLSNADFTVTTTSQPGVTVNQAAGQSDPTSTLPASFTVVFDRTVVGFTAGDVTMGGTATGVSSYVTPSGSAFIYTINVTSATGQGTLIPTISAGVCQDLAGNANLASTSTDNSVTYQDTLSPSVTVDQSYGQEDPTGTLPITFNVVFSETVTGFTSSDVTIGGTASGVVKNVTPVSFAAEYVITVTDATFGGTIIPSIAAGSCTDMAGNPNTASTSTDNSVTYQNTPANSIELSNGEGDVTIYGGPDFDYLTDGGAVVSTDINGDGINDIILGADENHGLSAGQGHGRVYIYYGSGGLGGIKDINGTLGAAPDVTITGADNFDLMTAAGALATGDLNDDGISDLIIGAMHADGPGNTRADAGEVYIVYGSSSLPSSISIASSGEDVTIYGAVAGRELTVDCRPRIGDLNGDGIDDLILATPDLGGTVYVIFGSAVLPATIDLANSEQNVTITSTAGLGYDDNIVVGELNGDGIDDLIIGCQQPRTYIIYGSRQLPPSISATDLSADVSVYMHHSPSRIALGDVNGDGQDDLVIGDDNRDGPTGTRYGAGEVYVIFGSANLPAVVSVAEGVYDAIIYGASNGDFLTETSLMTADINSDGIHDIIVGSKYADGPGESRPNCGEVYVVYGSQSLPMTYDLANNDQDIIIYGEASSSLSNIGGMTTGDVSGDGVADLILFGYPYNGSQFSAIYALFNSSGLPSAIDLENGYEDLYITHADVNSVGGQRAFYVTDVNHDGIDDIIAGHQSSSGPDYSRSNAGGAYVVFGSTGFGPTFVTSTVSHTDHSDNPLRKDYESARAVVDYSTGDNSSFTTVTLQRDNAGLALPDLSKIGDSIWLLQTNRSNATADLTFRYLNSEVPGMSESTLCVYKGDTLAGPFTKLTTTVTSATNSATVQDVGSFSFFVLVDGTDTDADGVPDTFETNTGVYVNANDTGSNPNVADSDNDGLSDGDEVNTYLTNPIVDDSDLDDLSDGTEVGLGSDPNDPGSVPSLSTVWVDFAFNSGVELGSTIQPFNTLLEATVVSAPGGTIKVKGNTAKSTTHETPRITKAVRIEASNGPVRIGVLSKELFAQEIGQGDGGDTGKTSGSRRLLDFLTALQKTLAGNRSTSAEKSVESKVREGTTYEPVLPYTMDEDGTHKARANSVLAVRLRSAAGIDAATLFAPVVADTPGVSVGWQPVLDGDARDLWVVVRPQDTWLLDDLVDVTAGAQSGTGETVETQTRHFRVESAEDTAARDAEPPAPIAQPPQPGVDFGANDSMGSSASAHVAPTGENAEVPTVEHGVETPVAISPEQVYDPPQRVWLPIPAGVDASAVHLYYYHPNGDDRGWYAAENVEGWLVPDSYATVAANGTTYLGFFVRHAGIVQLGIPK